MRADEFTPNLGLARYVEDLGAALGEAQEGESREIRLDFRRLAYDSLEPGAHRFSPTSVYGAAIVGDAEAQHPGLLVDFGVFGDRAPPIPGFAGRPLAEEGRLAAHLRDWGLSVDPATAVIPIGAPRPQFDPGGLVGAPGGMRGTLGTRARSGSGEEGVFTAGHVATAGSLVHDASGRGGMVVFSIDPAQVPAMRITADIALVVPTLPVLGGGVDLHTGVGKANPGTPVTIFGAASGVQQAHVMGLITPSLYLPSMSGQWATPYMLTRAASQAGDSGAPVIRSDTRELIGHVVGGDGLSTTFVQTIDVQLAAAQAEIL
jgi:hypothetical protein